MSFHFTRFTLIVAPIAATLVAACSGPPTAPPTATVKLYVADEGSGTISVIDAQRNVHFATIDLSEQRATGPARFNAHNVQVAPNGASVWVTAVPMAGAGHTEADAGSPAMDSGHGGHGGTDAMPGGAEMPEEIVIIDPRTDRVVARIELGTGLHVAHVVFDSTSQNAFVTANEGDRVLQIDTNSHAIVRRFELGTARGPHGLRQCGGRLFVANMRGLSMSVVDLGTGNVQEIPLGGVAVQTACTSDGRYAFVSLYDTREVVRYDVQSGELRRLTLPDGSQGPIQLYPTPDNRRVFVCDQGNLLGRPPSNRLYEVDADQLRVTSTMEVGRAAHGVIVNEDGTRAFVTNTLDNTVSVVDTRSHSVIATVAVGLAPNGIAHLHVGGGMP